MTFELDAPPADVLADFTDLATTLVNDKSGDRTRQLAAYLSHAELLCLEKQLRTTDFEERYFAGMVVDSFSAARRILNSAWENRHGVELSA